MDPKRVKLDVISAYDSAIVRMYCTIRFVIMNMRILEEVGQYIPERGDVLDAGCGFGLFSLYFAALGPERRFLSLDQSELRIASAMRAAGRLGLTERVELRAQKVQDLDPGQRRFGAAYTLDLLHHLPPPDVRPFLESLHGLLSPGGTLIVKEVSRRPAWKRLFTHALDLLVSPDQPPHYFEEHDLARLLREVGFDVKLHRMLDILPYPHVLYVCGKSA
jgi:2-polyprenyl-3-methyl-5-hydroxy-6-metoxy-1,4-benzoquinol methylase